MAKVLDLKTQAGKLGYTIRTMEDEATGTNKYFAALVPFSKLDKEYINKWAADFMKVSEAQMRVAFNALADAIQYFVLNGHSVTLDGLGNFTFSTKTGIWNAQQNKWTSAGRESMDDVKPTDIRATYIRFRPCTTLSEKLGASTLFCIDDTTFGYQVVNNNVKPRNNGGGGNGG